VYQSGETWIRLAGQFLGLMDTLSLTGFFNDMYPSETTRSLQVGKGSLYMRLTVSEGNMTLKKPSTL